MKIPRQVWMKGAVTVLVYAIAALLLYGDLPLIAAVLAGLSGLRAWLLARQVARWKELPSRDD